MDATIDKFLQYIRLELNLSPHTVTAYGTDLDQWEQYLTQGKRQLDVASVTPSDIRAWMLWLNNNGDGARTMRRKVQAVRSFYKWLMRQGVVTSSPAAAVEMARIPKRLPSMVRETSVDSLLDSDIDMDDFEQVRDHLILLMFYTTGLRRAELIGLEDKWVDMAARQLRVHGKRDKDRIVPFGPELAQWVERYRQVRAAQVGHTERFFVRRDGKPLYPSLVYRVVHNALLTVGGSGQLSPHVLRHSFASAMLNDGADLTSVKELLGHESLAATQVYTHITLSELKSHYKLAHPRALKKGG